MKASRLVSRGVLLAVLLSVGASGLLWAMPSTTETSTPTESVLQAARDLGFQPTALAASGCTVGEAQALLAKLSTEEESLATLLRARNEVSRLMGEVQNLRRGAGVVENAKQELAAAVSSLSSATTQLETARASLRQAVVSELSVSVRNRLELWESCQATGLSADLRVVAWTTEQRSELKAALAAERIARTRGTTLDAASERVLETARSHSDAVAARAALETNLNALTALFVAE